MDALKYIGHTDECVGFDRTDEFSFAKHADGITCNCGCHVKKLYRVIQRVVVEYEYTVVAMTRGEAEALAQDAGQRRSDEMFSKAETWNTSVAR